MKKLLLLAGVAGIGVGAFKAGQFVGGLQVVTALKEAHEEWESENRRISRKYSYERVYSPR